jgi:hypothetical protein
VGTLTTASQTNITSVGTLGSLAVTGNISGGNILGGANVNAITHTGATVSVTGNITGGNLSGTSIVGTLTTAAQTNITSVGTLTSLAVTGNITGGNLSGTSIVGTLTTASQTNITAVGTLTGLTINNGTTAITNAATNGTGNIGASGATFNTVFAKATTAQYADLAEMYAADADYEPGTVVDFGGTQEITISTTAASDRVAGVVSTDPAHLMNSTQQGDHVIAVALTGRVPTRVTGTVWKGAMMISAGNGHARACATPAIGTVIGKSLEDFSGDSGTIHVVVGRL